jgi:hypothetical protein
MNTTRISAKNLGLLMLDSFCERCFWLEIKFWNKNVPLRFFPPRLIGALDRFQKAMVEGYFDENGALPDWFDGMGEVASCVNVGKLKMEDEDTGLTLVGIPDLVVKFKDGKYGIVDFKTAPYKGGKDKLKPMYKVQVNAYAYLLKNSEGKNVNYGGFAYFEGDTGQITAVPHEQVTSFGHDFQFHVNVEKLDLKPAAVVRPLLDKVKEIFDLEEPPEARKGCLNCLRMAEYLDLVGVGDGKDAQMLTDAYRRDPYVYSMPTFPGVAELWDTTE